MYQQGAFFGELVSHTFAITRKTKYSYKCKLNFENQRIKGVEDYRSPSSFTIFCQAPPLITSTPF